MAETSPPRTGNTYQITEKAMKSLKLSRHSMGRRSSATLPARHTNYSENSNVSAASFYNDSTPPIDEDHEAKNNSNGGGITTAANTTNTVPSRGLSHSSNGSMWSSFVGRGQRLYGSFVSVASSITLTEFGGYDSDDDEFDITDRSLEDQINDEKPIKPQRQISVAAGLGLSWFSDHNRTKPPTPTPSFAKADNKGKSSSDLSPLKPNRKTSIQTLGNANSDQSLSVGTLGASREQAPKPVAEPPFARTNSNDSSKDSAPFRPKRKKSSSRLMDQSILEQSEEFHEATFVQVIKDILMQQQQIEGTTYDNVFVGQLAIDKMVKSGMADSRREALQAGRSLQETQELFHHIRDKDKALEDSSEDLYVLTKPSPPSTTAPPPLPKKMSSVRHLTDTSIAIEEEASLTPETAKHIRVPHVGRLPHHTL